jgi:hypothetical protein
MLPKVLHLTAWSSSLKESFVYQNISGYSPKMLKLSHYMPWVLWGEKI